VALRVEPVEDSGRSEAEYCCKEVDQDWPDLKFLVNIDVSKEGEEVVGVLDGPIRGVVIFEGEFFDLIY